MNEDELAAFLEGGQEGPGQGPVEDLRALLADESSWAQPDPQGADALLAAIGDAAPRQSESPERRVGGRPGDRPAGEDAHPGVARRRSALLLAVAAAVVVLVGITGVALLRGGDSGGDGAGPQLAIAGTELAPGASAVATTRDLSAGVAIDLDVSDLPPAEPGTFYQGWVKGPEGLVSVGTFHLRGGDAEIELWSGVDLERYPTLTVTIQQEGAGEGSSGQVVLTGPIVP